MTESSRVIHLVGKPFIFEGKIYAHGSVEIPCDLVADFLKRGYIKGPPLSQHIALPIAALQGGAHVRVRHAEDITDEYEFDQTDEHEPVPSPTEEASGLTPEPTPVEEPMPGILEAGGTARRVIRRGPGRPRKVPV